MESFYANYLERMQTLHHDFAATFEDLPAEALDWIPGDEMNSFGVLVVHTTGAARYWLGEVVFGESANRDRNAEFQAKGLSVAELKARFTGLEDYLRDHLERLTLADLSTIRSARYRDGSVKDITVTWALLLTLDHIGLHLGHAQITRQLWQQR